MLLIRTLGELGVYGDGGVLSGAATQPKRLAILALLARAGSRGVSRDHLLAMLWPDADEERGRRTLNQALYALRRDLGSEDAIAGTRDLRLDTAIVDSDVRRFDEARAAGRLEAAAELWSGPFLQGFNLPGVPEFERWMEEERTSLNHDYAGLLETLASRAGEPAAAIPWWRRLAALDPLNARVTEQLMRAQAATGDEAAALRQAEIFAACYEAELGVSPDPRVANLAAQIGRGELRSREQPPAVARPVTPAEAMPAVTAMDTTTPESRAAMTVTSGWATVALGAAPGTVAPPIPPAVQQTARRLRRWGWVAGGLVVLALLAVAVRRIPASRAARAPTAPRVLAVGRIADYTKSPNGDRSAPLSDMLATNLARVHGFEVVSTSRMYEVVAQLQREGDSSAGAIARAARISGATELVDGALYELSKGRLRLDLRRVNLATGSVASAFAVEGTDLFALADSATRDLGSAAGATAPEGTLASVSTQSEAAYRLYDAGLRAFSRSEFRAANAMFQAALEEDSAFAMAAYYAGLTDLDAGRRLDLVRRALALSNRASDRDRLYIRSGWGFMVSDPSFLAVAETLSIRFPTEVDGHYWRAQALTRDRRYLEAIPVFERVLQMDSLGTRPGARQCVACDAFAGLQYCYVSLDSFPAAERVARRWIAATPNNPRPYEALSSILAMTGRAGPAMQAVADAKARGLSGFDLAEYEWSTRLFLEQYDAADSVLEAAIPSAGPGDRAALWFDLAVTLRAQGRFREAFAAIQRGRDANPPGALRDHEMERALLQVKGQTLIEVHRFGEAAATFDSVGSLFNPRETELNKQRIELASLAMAAMARAEGGDTVHLAAVAESIARRTADSGLQRSRTLGNYLMGRLYAARGQPQKAIEYFKAAHYSSTLGLTLVDLGLARAYMTLGQGSDAVAVLQPALRSYRTGNGLYATRTTIHEELARAWQMAGNADSARYHWNRVVLAWSSADPMLAPRLAAARKAAGDGS